MSEATAEDPDLKISDKLLAVFLLLSFPGDQFGTIRDQLFGDLKVLSTSKVISRLQTKSALNSVDESVTAMSASAGSTYQTTNCPVIPRTNKSPSAPCHLKEHWSFTHSNGVCSKQQHRKNGGTQRNNQNPNNAHHSTFSDAEKIKRFNQMAAAGIIGFNSEAQVHQPPHTPAPVPTPATQPCNSIPSVDCQYATSYNVTVGNVSNETQLKISAQYPPASATNKPTLADTACNRHMFGDAMLLDNIHDIEPVSIKVANTDESSRIVATKIGTARLHAYGIDWTPTYVDVANIL